MAKEKKKREAHYEPKLKVKEGTRFIDLIDSALGLPNKAKKKAPKKG